MKNIESNFQFIDSYIRKANIIINDRDINNSNMEFLIEVIKSNIEATNEFLSAEIRLINKAYLTNDKGDRIVEIHVEMSGFFRGKRMSEEDFTNYLKYSGVPMLSQSIRAYVMSLTSLSGIESIRLPLINFNEFFKEKEF